MTVKKVSSNAKTQVLGNRNREQGRENFFVKDVSSEELDSFEARGRPKLDWMRRMRRWFL